MLVPAVKWLAAVPLGVVLGASCGAAAACMGAYHACTGLWRRRALPLAGEAVVLTGAAGGFGREVGRRLLQQGATVYALDVVSEDAIRAAFDSHRALVAISVDIASPEALAEAANRIKKDFSDSQDGSGRKLFALVNNAGIIPRFGTTVEVTMADTRRTFDVNFFAAAELTKLLFPILRHSAVAGASRQAGANGRASRSRVVNIASIAGLVSTPGMGAYNASKFALEAWSDATRMELNEYIDVALVEPFFARTNIISGIIDVPEEELRRSIRGEQYLRARERAKGWVAGTKHIMSAAFVAESILHAIRDAHPQDRYIVAPNIAVRAITAVMAHFPNYFYVIDKLKDAVSRRDL